VAENDVQVTTPQKLPLSQSSCLLSLPNELLLQIGQYLQEPDLNSLCRTNRQLYILLTHILYRKGKEIEFLDGSTLLHWACERGLTNTVHHLLDEGANPNAKYNRAPHPLQSDGRTPLHIAAEGGHRAITKHLLAKAAKTKVWDKHGNTALHIAVQNGYRRIIKLLVTSGSANINARNIEGLRPLHIAILHGQRYALKLLLSLGAKATATDTIGGSALHLAASFDTSGVCEALIDAGADPNVQDRAGMTPLHWAAYSGYESTARLLVHLGARATERDFDGKLPQHLAFGNNQSTYLYLQQLTTTTQGNVRKKESVDGSSSLSPECVPLGEMLFRTATRLKASGVDIEDAVVGTINGGASGMEQVGYDDLVL
jgi:ankyrin repeat protein